MTSESRWISEPSFLSKHRSDWPKQEILQPQYVKIAFFPSLVPVTETVVNLKRFSSWNKSIRVIAFCFFFADKCKKRSKDIQLGHYTKSYLHIIQTTQKQDFKAEDFALKKGDVISSSSRLKLLSPFIDKNNQLRARVRLSKANLLKTSRYPLIIDGNNIATRLLIQHTHELDCHCGQEQTRNIPMEYYWILRCRAVVKQTIRHFLPCRQMIQDVSIPKMADLPQERLPKNNQFVFETTGLDFIGPFPVKNKGKLFSRYVLLFTSLFVRAVHLEVSNDLSTESTINCIRRFVSRRGKPNKFISDCGKTFVGSNNSLQSSIANLRASKSFAAKLHLMIVEIVWKFNPPAAPHVGGIWERLVQIFKLSLYKVIESRTLTDEILCTLTCEIETNMNSRPLTNVPSDMIHYLLRQTTFF